MAALVLLGIVFGLLWLNTISTPLAAVALVTVVAFMATPEIERMRERRKVSSR